MTVFLEAAPLSVFTLKKSSSAHSYTLVVSGEDAADGGNACRLASRLCWQLMTSNMFKTYRGPNSADF